MRRPVAYLAGVGKGVPAHVMTNHDFAAIGIETSHEWIHERTGIAERRIAKEATETTAQMAADHIGADHDGLQQWNSHISSLGNGREGDLGIGSGGGRFEFADGTGVDLAAVREFLSR